ncbi:MAG: hypothetical protein LBS04_02950 [Tannerellaceae bacterium]|nr:hypothetical protein [Tannerellaceae bacterium]
MGCKFRDAENPDKDSAVPSEQLLNCFISILNGHEIDADRLDYAMRDKWATGLNTATINLDRILSSMYITDKSDDVAKKDYVICFKKKGLSELQGLLDMKNFTSFWIFNHHKVKYNEELLIKAVKKLSLLFRKEGKTEDKVEKYIEIKNNLSIDEQEKKEQLDTLENNAMYDLIDYKNLIEPKEFFIQIDNKTYYDNLFLMSDDDIVHLLKKYFCIERKYVKDTHLIDFFKNATYAKEWLSRDQVLVPVWKSYSEYNVRFLKPFILELDAIIRMLECINLLPTKKRKNIKYYNDLLSSDLKLKLLIDKIKLYGRSPAVNIILDKKKTSISKNLFDDIKSALKRAELYYSEKDSIEAILKKVSIEIINKIKNERFIVKPETNLPKIIPIEKLNINEIPAESVFVEMNEDIFCYTELNLPQKTNGKTIVFFMFLCLGYLMNKGK